MFHKTPINPNIIDNYKDINWTFWAIVINNQ